MLVDQRRSRSGPAPRHGARFLLRHCARRTRATGVGRPAGRRVPCRAPPPATLYGPGRRPVARRTRRAPPRCSTRPSRRAAHARDGRPSTAPSPSTPPWTSTSTRRWRWSARWPPSPATPTACPPTCRPRPPCSSADVLPDWTEAWLAVERERFRQIRLNALEELSSALTASGRFADAVVTARAAVHTAPSREGARRALIEAHLAQGEIAEAVAEYDEYQELLRSSVGAPRCPGSTGAFGLDGLLPPVPAWPVLRPPPGRAGARGGPRAARRARHPSARVRRIGARHHPLSPSPLEPGPARCRRSGVRVRGVHAWNFRTRHRARPAPRPCPRDRRRARRHPADQTEGDAPGTTGTGEARSSSAGRPAATSATPGRPVPRPGPRQER